MIEYVVGVGSGFVLGISMIVMWHGYLDWRQRLDDEEDEG